MYTSGTTGWSKKLLLDSAFEDRRNESRARIYSFSKDTITYEPVGLSSGLGAKSAPAVWHVGGCVVYDRRPDHLKRIFQHGVNSSTLTAPLLKDLVQSLDTSEPPDHDRELFVTAGFLSSALAEKAISRLTKRLGITYATSEIGTALLVSLFATINDMHWLAADEGRMIQIVDERGN